MNSFIYRILTSSEKSQSQVPEPTVTSLKLLFYHINKLNSHIFRDTRTYSHLGNWGQWIYSLINFMTQLNCWPSTSFSWKLHIFFRLLLRISNNRVGILLSRAIYFPIISGGRAVLWSGIHPDSCCWHTHTPCWSVIGQVIRKVKSKFPKGLTSKCWQL